MDFFIPLFLLAATICSQVSAVPPSPSNNEALLYIDGIGVLQDDYILTTTDITTTKGVLCVGGNGLSSIAWILPNGFVLQNGQANVHSNVKFEMTNPSTAKIGAAGSGPIAPSGTFTCRASFSNGEVRLKRVWILEGTSNLAPSVNASLSSCSYIGTDIQNQTHGILLTLSVQQGPPSTVECRASNQAIVPSSISTTVINSISPAVRLSIMLSVAVGGSGPLVCTARNRIGNSDFTCNLQGGTGSRPSITNIDRQSSRMATITWTGGPPGSSYAVLVESTDGKDFIQFKDITIQGTMATISGLHPPLAYYVAVTASPVPSTSSADTATLPSVSERQSFGAQQCSPSLNEKVSLDLKIYKNTFDCSSVTPQFTQELLQMAISNSQGNCSYSDAQMSSCELKGTKKKTKTKTQTKTKTVKNSKTYLTIEAELNCGPCSEQAGATESTKRTPGTKRTTGTPGRRRGKRTRETVGMRQRRAPKTRVEFTVRGQTFKGYLKTDSGSYSCGSTLLPSRTRYRQGTLCDCPTQCYTNINKGFKCLAAI